MSPMNCILCEYLTHVRVIATDFISTVHPLNDLKIFFTLKGVFNHLFLHSNSDIQRLKKLFPSSVDLDHFPPLITVYQPPQCARNCDICSQIVHFSGSHPWSWCTSDTAHFF